MLPALELGHCTAVDMPFAAYDSPPPIRRRICTSARYAVWAFSTHHHFITTIEVLLACTLRLVAEAGLCLSAQLKSVQVVKFCQKA